MRFFKINILFFLNVVFIYTHAQYSFKGTVKDDKTAETLTGVNIKVNNSKGAITDFNGQFSLDLAKGSHKILISYVGYETKLIDVEIDKKTLTFELKDNRKIDHKMLNLLRNEKNICYRLRNIKRLM